MQVWDRFLARLVGPMNFRFILQPLAAILLGIRDGVKDARDGAPPYLLALITGEGDWRAFAASHWKSLRGGLAVAILLDVIVQYLLFQSVRIAGAIVVGTLLIAVPYAMARGLTNRIVSRRVRSTAGLASTRLASTRSRHGGESAAEHSPAAVRGGSTMSDNTGLGEGKILTALVFPDKYRAAEAKVVLMRLADEGKIQIHDSAVVVRYEDGKVRLHTETDPAAAGRTGGLWLGIAGALLTGMLPMILAGPVAGHVAGRFLDKTIDDRFMKDLGETMQPGTSVLFVLVRQGSTDREAVLGKMSELGGRVFYTNLPEAMERQLIAELAAKQDAS